MTEKWQAKEPVSDDVEGLAAAYTRTGDDGTTTLGDLSSVAKTDSRIAAYAACEEANAAIGVAIASASAPSQTADIVLVRVQNDLLEVQGDLGTPVPAGPDPQRRIDDGYVSRVEKACDFFERDLPPLSTSVLPSGTETGALLYQASSLVRRAERAAWRALEEHDGVNVGAARYLNRLGSLLFVLARVSNAEHGDVLWQPGLTATEGLLPGGPDEEPGGGS